MAGLSCFSVDVEEYFHAEVFARSVPREAWTGMERRAAEPLEWLGEMLESTGNRATFFVLGWTIPYLKRQLRELLAAGHEIACHGQNHAHLARMTPSTLRADLCESKARIEDAIGAAVRGYRAPTFSVTHATSWALDEIIDAGFTYDSSIFPIRHDRYGIPDAPIDPFLAVAPSGRELLELPPLTLSWGPLRAPLGGGGYLRLVPAAWIRRAVQHRAARGRATMLYVHPWELDPQQPLLPARALATWRHRVQLGRTREKLRHILETGRFIPAREVCDSIRTSPRFQVGKQRG